MTETIQRATAPTKPDLTREFIERGAWKQAVIASINVLVRVLAARLIVLIGVGGGIFLAYLALDHPDWFRLGVLGLYCAGVVLPAVVLAALGR